MLVITIMIFGFPRNELCLSLLQSQAVSCKKHPFILFCIYKLSVKLDNGKIKNFECDCCYWLKHIWEIELSDAAYSFISNSYFPANFLPVPQGFNTGRSNFGKWDSWDLTLNQIYQWYMDNPQMNDPTNDCALAEMFIHAQNKYCTEWLKNFHSWKNFVELNYMRSFLLPDGRPKRFFVNHTLEYGLPKTIDEYEEFFQSVVICIEKRGDDMNKHLYMG